MTGEPTHTASKERNGAAHPSYQLLSEKWSIHYTSLLAMFNPLPSIMNQELFEKHLCNQSSHFENTDDFCYKGKPSCATAKSTPFAVWWMWHKWRHWQVHEKCIVHTAVCQKTHVWLKIEQWKKIKHVAFKLCLSEGISQSVTHAVSQ